MALIKLIVGLGNPGLRYEKTRHNAGFWFLDGLRVSGWAKEARFGGEVTSCLISGRKYFLLKPTTYMNRSGSAVGGLARYYHIEPQEILVAHDELDLEVGEVRLKKNGGLAGHNGLKDIAANLGSRDFARLRLGVGRPDRQKVVDYVLSEPTRAERLRMEASFEKVYEHMGLILSGEFDRAMNVLHG